MNNSLKKIPAISWTWREGHYFDLWMFVHLISGLIIGNILAFLPFSAIVAVWVALILLYLGEAIEFLLEVKESRINRILDIIIGFVGFIASYTMLADVAQGTRITSLIVLAILSAGGNFLGWRAHKKRAHQ